MSHKTNGKYQGRPSLAQISRNGVAKTSSAIPNESSDRSRARSPGGGVATPPSYQTALVKALVTGVRSRFITS